MEDHIGLDLSHAAADIFSNILGSLPLRDRCICALVCKAWAEAATAATHSIILKHKMQDLSSLQHWLERNGDQLEVLQLHSCSKAVLDALPCCAKLQDLLLRDVNIASRTWGNIASGTKLTSVSLEYVTTATQQADVVAALTALPDLEQLTWCHVYCSREEQLSDSLLLQQMTGVTSLELHCVTAAALQHLGSLTKLQHLNIGNDKGWVAADCLGLQELKALTSLKLWSWEMVDVPTAASQLTALRQLDVQMASPTGLNRLHVLTGLTLLRVRGVTGMTHESPPLELPGLQHLELFDVDDGTIPVSFLASCKRLQVLKLLGFQLQGPGSLVASTMLQHLMLFSCNIVTADDAAADPVPWQQVLPGPGWLPHLTCLELWTVKPALQQADINRVVEGYSNLGVLGLDILQDGFVPALARLPDLSNLCLSRASDEQCSALLQLTGLRQVSVSHPRGLSAVGLRHLAALTQLTNLGFGKFYCGQLDTLADHFMKDKLPDCQYAIIKAPSGPPPDVSHQLLDLCNVVDACAGLDMEAVIDTAERELKPSGPSGYDRLERLTAEALLAAAAALKARGNDDDIGEGISRLMRD